MNKTIYIPDDAEMVWTEARRILARHDPPIKVSEFILIKLTQLIDKERSVVREAINEDLT